MLKLNFRRESERQSMKVGSGVVRRCATVKSLETKEENLYIKL